MKLINILILLLLVFSACSLEQSTEPYGYIEIENKKINLVGIADTPQERYTGLSFRESICPDCGMLFSFDDKKNRTFVMRDMEFPLDIIWISDKKIVKIHKNLEPEGHNPKNLYSSDTPVDSVLEVNGGFSEINNIEVGDKLKIHKPEKNAQNNQ